jgi:hypothetical protein
MVNFSFFAHLHGFRSTSRDAVLGRPVEFNRPAYQLQSSGTVLKVYTRGASIEPAATHSETKPIRYIHATSGGLTHVQEQTDQNHTYTAPTLFLPRTAQVQ